MREPCPRCGADRPALGACPSCGYQPQHPGVLGSYGEAARRLVDRPSLFVPFLVPTLVLFGTQVLLLEFGQAGDPGVGGPAQAAAGLAALFLQVAWYFVAVGTVAPSARGEASLGAPDGSVFLASVLGAGIVVAPWSLIASILVVQPAGSLGALALLSAVLLLIAAVFVAGRAVGLPVEAALTDRRGRELVRAGNRRGRENGGLGLVFLALLIFGLLTLLPGVLSGLGLIEASRWTLLSVGAVTSWLLGAWIGTAIAIGLIGEEHGIEARFTCPACGREAIVEDGRARCECGLEGPYYQG